MTGDIDKTLPQKMDVQTFVPGAKINIRKKLSLRAHGTQCVTDAENLPVPVENVNDKDGEVRKMEVESFVPGARISIRKKLSLRVNGNKCVTDAENLPVPVENVNGKDGEVRKMEVDTFIPGAKINIRKKVSLHAHGVRCVTDVENLSVPVANVNGKDGEVRKMEVDTFVPGARINIRKKLVTDAEYLPVPVEHVKGKDGKMPLPRRERSKRIKFVPKKYIDYTSTNILPSKLPCADDDALPDLCTSDTEDVSCLSLSKATTQPVGSTKHSTLKTEDTSVLAEDEDAALKSYKRFFDKLCTVGSPVPSLIVNGGAAGGNDAVKSEIIVLPRAVDVSQSDAVVIPERTCKVDDAAMKDSKSSVDKLRTNVSPVPSLFVNSDTGDDDAVKSEIIDLQSTESNTVLKTENVSVLLCKAEDAALKSYKSFFETTCQVDDTATKSFKICTDVLLLSALMLNNGTADNIATKSEIIALPRPVDESKSDAIVIPERTCKFDDAPVKSSKISTDVLRESLSVVNSGTGDDDPAKSEIIDLSRSISEEMSRIVDLSHPVRGECQSDAIVLPCPGGESLSDAILIPECTCDQDPWLCDFCVSGLKNKATAKPDDGITIDLESLPSLSSDADKQEGLCDENGEHNVSFVAQPVDSKVEVADKCLVVDPSGKSLDYAIQSRTSTSEILSKKSMPSEEEGCTCGETKGLCPQCIGKLNGSLKPVKGAVGKHSATVSARQSLVGDTVLPDAIRIKRECFCDVTPGLCRACVVKRDETKAKDARKHRIGETNTTSQASLPDVSVECTCRESTDRVCLSCIFMASKLSDAVSLECTCRETTGACLSCVSMANKLGDDEQVRYATAASLSVGTTSQLNAYDRVLKTSCGEKRSCDTVVESVTVPSKKQRIASASSQPTARTPSKTSGVDWATDCCFNCGRSVMIVSLSKCSTGHPCCMQCALFPNKVATGYIRCLYSGCNSWYPPNKHWNPPSPIVIADDVRSVFSMTKQVGGSTEDKHIEIDSDDDLPSYNTQQTVDSLTLPREWAPMDINGDMKCVDISPWSADFKTVAQKFRATMPHPQMEIVSIRRVQNPILWQFYSVMRKRLLQNNGADGLNETMLFHGTSSSYVNTICKNNFDWRLCGKHGTSYGQGSYFALDASYSHRYTDQSTFVPAPPPPQTNAPVQAYNPQTGQPTQPTPFAAINAAMWAQQPPAVSPHTNTPIQGYYPQSGQPTQFAAVNAAMWAVIQPPPPVASPIPVARGKRGRKKKAPPAPRRATYAAPAPSSQTMRKHTMFFARVLAGKCARGKSSFRTPPPLKPSDPYGECYDSCVDDTGRPGIYVIFKTAQTYPEYIIEYTSA